MKKSIQKILSLICITALLAVMPGTSIPMAKADTTKETVVANTKKSSENNLRNYVKPIFIDIDESAIKNNSNIFSDKKYSYSQVDYTWEKYADSYYYNQMNIDEQILYDRLDAMCMNYLTTSVDTTETYTDPNSGDIVGISNYISCADLDLTVDEAQNVLLIFYYSNPQYYFLATYFGCDEDYVGLTLFDIFSEGSTRSNYTSRFQSQITQWENSYSTATNIYEKEKAIHDVICDNVSYDEDGIDNIYNQSSISAVLNYEEFSQKTVCAGYAKTFELLCNSAGIETINVTSETHEWNKVRLYGNWYNVDCTWDDSDGQAPTNYDFFNTSDTTLQGLDQGSAHVSESLWAGLLPACSNDFDSSTGIISNYVEIPKLSCLTVDGGKQITLTDAQSDAAIYYTTDGSTPTASSTRYTSSFKVSTSCTVKAIAIYNGYKSNVESVPVEVIAVSNPTITSSGNKISISCSMPGATIYYTTDGSIPSVSSNKYTGSFAVTADKSVKAIAVKSGYANSSIMSYSLASTQTLADGIYSIASALNNSKVLDIAGGSPFNGANLQLYSSNGSYAQMFKVEYLKNGYYKLTSIVSDKVLDVAAAGKSNGTNVWQYSYNGSDAQQWIIVDNGDGTYSLISKCNGLYLDVYGSNISNGTNIQTWNGNNSNAQKFVFKEITLSQAVSNGTYAIASSLNVSKALDIPGASKSDGANLQLYDANGTAAQKYQITYLNNGYYSITSINSGKVLDVAGAGTSNGTTVWQYTLNNSLAQQWLIRANGDGTYSLVSKCNSLYLDVYGGSTSNGTKIHVWSGNSSKAQKFYLIKYN